MLSKNFKTIMVLTAIVTFGIAAVAFAGWGRGYGPGAGAGSGCPGWYNKGGSGYGQGYAGNLSEEEMAKLDQQRTEFFNATENIRQKLYEKDLALRSELAKENPDSGRAAELQSEISTLQGEFDQKRLDYEIRARKLAPNYGRGYGVHGGPGMMMGRGYGGGKPCWR
jgi:zinc resistance-associated protein